MLLFTAGHMFCLALRCIYLERASVHKASRQGAVAHRVLGLKVGGLVGMTNRCSTKCKASLLDMTLPGN